GHHLPTQIDAGFPIRVPCRQESAFGRFERGEEQAGGGQLGEVDVGPGGLAPAGANDGESSVVLTGSQRREREDTIAKGDFDIDTLTYGELDRLCLFGLDREAVGVGDGHAVATEGDLEDGVATSVDEP